MNKQIPKLTVLKSITLKLVLRYVNIYHKNLQKWNLVLGDPLTPPSKIDAERDQIYIVEK